MAPSTLKRKDTATLRTKARSTAAGKSHVCKSPCHEIQEQLMKDVDDYDIFPGKKSNFVMLSFTDFVRSTTSPV